MLVGADERRGAHAQILRNVLDEVLIDGNVSEKEVRYLSGVRTFLQALGWTP
jgi:hypothetical protein